MAQGTVLDHPVVLLKPMTFMNRSGRAVRAAMQHWKISLSNSIIVHDDLYTPLVSSRKCSSDLNLILLKGAVKLKAGGSAAGHNGVQDILNKIPGDWLRLRFGISEPPGTQRIEQYVLAPFHRNEQSLLEQGILRSVSALDIWLTLGAAIAQNETNPNRPQIPTLAEVLKRRAQRREMQQKAAASAASAPSKPAAPDIKG